MPIVKHDIDFDVISLEDDKIGVNVVLVLKVVGQVDVISNVNDTKR